MMMTDLSTYQDRELMAHVARGSAEAEPAFAEIYRRYARRLYLYSYKVMGTQATARDVVQDVFLKFLLKVREGLIVDSVPAFLLTMARNLCLNHKRDARVEYMEPDLLPVGVMEHDHDRDELLAHVSAAMQTLPPQYREALMMQVYGGLSYAEICEALNETLPVVRHRISRAKQRLRAALLPLFTA